MSSISTSTDAALAQQISVAVALKARDAAKTQGEAVVAMLDQAAQLQQQVASSNPRVGRRVDVRG